MADKFTERRLNPRIDIDGDMRYQTPGSDEVCAGLLENLSLGGARVWVAQELPAESELLVRVDADSPEEAGLEFRATVLHMLPQQKVSLYGYGCRIEASADWPPEVDLTRVPRSKGDA